MFRKFLDILGNKINVIVRIEFRCFRVLERCVLDFFKVSGVFFFGFIWFFRKYLKWRNKV